MGDTLVDVLREAHDKGYPTPIVHRAQKLTRSFSSDHGPLRGDGNRAWYVLAADHY